MNMGLSWVVDKGINQAGGNSRDPTLRAVLDLLEVAKVHSGTVTLYKLKSPGIGAQDLQVKTEGGRSILMLGEETSEDHEVRSYKNLNSIVSETVEILGDAWSSKLVCDDYGIVIECFTQFWNYGDVSTELLGA